MEGRRPRRPWVRMTPVGEFVGGKGMPGNRKHPPHFPPVRGDQSIVIFLTVCSKDRQPRFANPTAHRALRDAWVAAADWRVGRYVILPDHIHLFCAPAVEAPLPLQNWVELWKRFASRLLGFGRREPLWQRHFWDTQLRRGDSYASKWEYVRQNPVRHGLVAAVEDWPYQGELAVLPWFD